MGAEVQRLTVRVKKEDAVKLKKIAIDNDTNVSEILRSYVEKTVKRGSLE
jgi:hypothetical protein